MRIWNLFDPGSGMEKFGSRSRDKHPGSAALLKIIKTFRQQRHRGNFIVCFYVLRHRDLFVDLDMGLLVSPISPIWIRLSCWRDLDPRVRNTQL
jgi:hypothetical protein